MALFRVLCYSIFGLIIYNICFGFPNTSYVFKIKNIRDIARKHSGKMSGVRELVAELSQLYPENVLYDDAGWLPTYTGGLHGQVNVLYASLTEFLVLYHSEMESSGYSGRHHMNVSISVLQGKMECVTDANRVRPSFVVNPGNNHVLRKWTSASIKLSPKTRMLLYGRGIVPLTFGYWVSESLFVHHDPLLVIVTLWWYIKAVAMNHFGLWKWMKQGIFNLW